MISFQDVIPEATKNEDDRIVKLLRGDLHQSEPSTSALKEMKKEDRMNDSENIEQDKILVSDNNVKMHVP